MTRYILRILVLQNEWSRLGLPYNQLITRMLVATSSVARLVEVFCEGNMLNRPQPAARPISRAAGQSVRETSRRNVNPLAQQSKRSLENNLVIETSLASGVITYISPSCSNILGYEPGDIVDAPLAPFLKRPVFSISRSGSTSNFQAKYTAHKRDGGRLRMRAHGMLVSRDDGRPDSCVWVARPVSDDDESSPSSPTSAAPGAKDDHAASETGAWSLERNGDENDGEKDDEQEGERGSVVPVATDLILCHICERSIPALAFQTHNEACSKVHRAEMDIGLLDEAISNARDALEERTNLLDREMQQFSLDKRREPMGKDGVLLKLDYREIDHSTDGLVREYLGQLYTMGMDALKIADAVSSINARPLEKPGESSDNYDDEEDEDCLDWECPAQSAFYPPASGLGSASSDEKGSSSSLQVPKEDGNSWPSSTMLEVALSEIGVGVYNLCNTLSEIVVSKREVRSNSVNLPFP